MTNLASDTRVALQSVSTATLATALFKRGLRHQVVQNVTPLSTQDANTQRSNSQYSDSQYSDSQYSNMVGPAFTLRYIPAREDLNPLSVFENRTHPQRAAIEACPAGAVMVIDSRNDPRAASAGSILVTRLMVRGAAGIVTDGGFRDSTEIARIDLPSYHQRASAPTNLTLHQAIDMDVPIGCGGAPVFPGDVVVGDGEAVIVIPASIADEVAAEATEMTVFEGFVMEQVQKGCSIIGLYPATDAQVQNDFAAWRIRHKR